MGEYKVEKLAKLTDEQCNKIKKGGSLSRDLRKLLKIPQNKKIYIGNSMTRIGSASSKGDVFKLIYPKAAVIYIVIKPFDEQMAFCYTINFKKSLKVI